MIPKPWKRSENAETQGLADKIPARAEECELLATSVRRVMAAVFETARARASRFDHREAFAGYETTADFANERATIIKPSRAGARQVTMLEYMDGAWSVSRYTAFNNIQVPYTTELTRAYCVADKPMEAQRVEVSANGRWVCTAGEAIAINPLLAEDALRLTAHFDQLVDDYETSGWHGINQAAVRAVGAVATEDLLLDVGL